MRDNSATAAFYPLSLVAKADVSTEPTLWQLCGRSGAVAELSAAGGAASAEEVEIDLSPKRLPRRLSVGLKIGYVCCCIL